MRHDSFMCDTTYTNETRTIHMTFQLTIFFKKKRHTSRLYEAWLIHVRHDSYKWDMNNSYDIPTDHIFPPSVFCLKKKDTTHAYTWLIHVRHNSYVWSILYSGFQLTIFSRLDSSVSKTKNVSSPWDMTHLCETRLIHMRHNSYKWDMTHSCGAWFHMREWLPMVPRRDYLVKIRDKTHPREYTNIYVCIWFHMREWLPMVLRRDSPVKIQGHQSFTTGSMYIYMNIYVYLCTWFHMREWLPIFPRRDAPVKTRNIIRRITHSREYVYVHECIYMCIYVHDSIWENDCPWSFDVILPSKQGTSLIHESIHLNAACCSVSHCVAECCSVLHCVADNRPVDWRLEFTPIFSEL